MNTCIEAAIQLKHKLHTIPEPSMHEYKTKDTLIHFLSTNTTLDIIDMGFWFYVKYEPIPGKAFLTLRADYDAVPAENGSHAHLCGHDAHAASLAGVALYLDKERPNQNVILLFQPGEETGEGAKECVRLFDLEPVEMIFGIHNIPGYPLGQVLTCKRTFACASCGLEIALSGKPAHAANPETGTNPAYFVVELLSQIQQFLEQPRKGILLSTVIGIHLGSEHYGVSASSGVLRLTIRGEYKAEFERLYQYIEEQLTTLSDKYGIHVSTRVLDDFPATTNHENMVVKVEDCCIANGIPYKTLTEPFRWSEDFGHYLEYMPGAFFGVGSGTECNPLHTKDYILEDVYVSHAMNIMAAIISE